MKNIKQILKKNYKLYIGVIIGIVVSSISVYAAATINSNDVSYSNENSGLNSSNVQGAIDEVANKADIRNKGNFVTAYTYNQTTSSSNYCVTGEEDTCVKTECYKDKSSGSCKIGDIIKYKVNDTDIVTFHVMSDKGSTIKMQSQKNIINAKSWYAKDEYISRNSNDVNTNGPLTVLSALESATSGWNNVNDQNYSVDKLNFSFSFATSLLAPYNLPIRTKAKARIATLAELPYTNIPGKFQYKWIYNYLYDSTSSGGTVNDNNKYPDGVSGIGGLEYKSNNVGYWVMNIEAKGDNAYYVSNSGKYARSYVNTYGETNQIGARAVVEVSK